IIAASRTRAMELHAPRTVACSTVRQRAIGQPPPPWLRLAPMSSRESAAAAARFLVPAVALTFALGVASCGSQSGTSTFLPPGPPTKAPPGNTVLYAAMTVGNRIDAYRLGTDGLLPSKPFDTIFLNQPHRLAIGDGVLYATLTDQIVAMKLGADGSLPSIPT